MRKNILLICAAACLTSAGCNDQWKWNWPGTQPVKPAPAKRTSTPPDPAGLTDQQRIAQLQRQIKTLRERLDVIEDENAKLRNSNKTVTQLQKELDKQKFALKMQNEDLRVLKTAAIERDLYKTRCERLQRRIDALTKTDKPPATTTKPATP